jgi:hypothetical protein
MDDSFTAAIADIEHSMYQTWKPLPLYFEKTDLTKAIALAACVTLSRPFLREGKVGVGKATSFVRSSLIVSEW